MSARLRLLGLALLALATTGMLAVAGHDLGPTSSADPSAWWTWLAAADPVTVTIALVRVVTIASTTWIALTAVLHLVLAEVGGIWGSLRPRGAPNSRFGAPEGPCNLEMPPTSGFRWLDRLTPRLVRTAAGASLAAALLATSPSALAGGDPHHQATMRPLVVDGTTSTTTAPTTNTVPPTTTTSLPPTTVPPTTTTTAPPITSTTVPSAPVPAPAARPAPARPDTYVVERADSLWSIAADTVEERLGRTPADAEIVSYWLELIATNADRLVVPGNADLIYAGQELLLPS